MKLKSLQNVNYKILKDFDLSFEHENENLDLIVLAGINGSGKTTILDFIYEKLKNNKEELEGDIFFECNNESIKSDSLFNIAIKYKTQIEDINNKVLYIKAKENKTNELKTSIIRYIKNMIFEKEISPKETYRKFDEYLKNIFQDMEISISFGGLDKDENIYFKNSFGEKVLIDNLSTGEKEILNKVFYFFIKNIKNSIILIDEPEISLHPSWQGYIIKVYQKLSSDFNNQIIIATHSPQIIASTPNKSLIILTKENEKIIAKNYNSYGKDINSVLVDIMGIEFLRDIDVEKQIKKIKNMIFENQFNTEKFKNEFDNLETILENDNIELSLIKLELKRQQNAINR